MVRCHHSADLLLHSEDAVASREIPATGDLIMELLFYIILALVAGACAPTQAGINAQLRVVTGDPTLAALISFAVGTLSLLACVLLLRITWPAVHTFWQLPWWMWTGGCLGAFLVFVTIILAPKLGAATTLAFMIAGQMLTSLILDHYGLVGFPEHPASAWRLVGGVFLVIGVVMIKRF
jgi:bacterial/archaeal transporter family-2 protein